MLNSGKVCITTSIPIWIGLGWLRTRSDGLLCFYFIWCNDSRILFFSQDHLKWALWRKYPWESAQMSMTLKWMKVTFYSSLQTVRFIQVHCVVVPLRNVPDVFLYFSVGMFLPFNSAKKNFWSDIYLKMEYV